MNRMQQKPVALAITLALAAFAAQAAQAEETTQQLPEMTVSQSRPAVLSNNPANVATVTQAQMQEMNIVNTEDALRYMPSMNIRKRFIGDTNGVISARTSVGTVPSATSLVYADGLLLANLLGNSYSYPPRWGVIGTEEIESIDVLYGPFSAMLPGNSVGATVMMTTKRPAEPEAHVRAQAHSESYNYYGTKRDFNGNQIQGNAMARFGNLGISLFGNRLDAEGHPMSFSTAGVSTTNATGADKVVTGVQRDTDFQGKSRLIFGGYSMSHSIQETAKVKLDYDFSPDTRLAFTYAEWRNNATTQAETYLRDANGNPVWGGTVNIDGKRYTVSSLTPGKSTDTNTLMGINFTSKLNNDWKLEVIASDYRTPESVSRAPNSYATTNGGAGTMTIGADTGWTNLDIKTIWKPNGGAAGHTVTAGYHQDEYTMTQSKYNITNWATSTTTSNLSTKAKGNTSTEAIFVQDAWKFDPRWTLTAGLRHEQWREFGGSNYDSSSPSTSGNYKERQYNYNSPKLSLAWQTTPQWQIRASLARAYRFPTVNELFGTYTDGSGNKTMADASLRPERILAKDLTAEGTLGGGLMRVSLFEENKDDYLLSQTTTNSNGTKLTAMQNVGKTWVRGAEMAYQVNDLFIKGFDLQGNLTFTQSKVTDNPGNSSYVGRPLAIPKWRANLFASYRVNEAWSGSLGVRYSTEYPNLDPTYTNQDVYGGSSGYTFVDARINYRFNKHAALAVGVDNLNNDKAYAFHPYSQRTVHAQLRADF